MLTPTDRVWFEQLGGTWPEADQEADWLQRNQELIDIGSQVLRKNTDPQIRAEIVGTRSELYAQLPLIEVNHDAILERYPAHLPPHRSIPVLRLLQTCEVNPAGLFDRHNLRVLSLREESLQERLDTLHYYGVNGDAVSRNFSVLTFTPDRVHASAQPMLAAARAFGWDEPLDVVRTVLARYPTILNYTPDRTRVLAQIASRLFAPSKFRPEYTNNIFALYATPPARVVAAYLKHQTSIDDPKTLRNRAYTYKDDNEQALQYMISQHPDDPVVRAYLLGYPIQDADAARRAYERQHESHNTEISLHWAGPGPLGSPALPVAKAFRVATLTPELTDEEYTALTDAINNGIARRQAAEGTIDELDPAVEAAANAERTARRTLIIRHLGIVTALAARYGKGDDHEAELIGAGNVALVAAAESYNPQTDADFRAVATAAVRLSFGREEMPGKVPNAKV
jgi:hypothetical protein